MKTIGMLGGMSWESTVSYYRMINERVRETRGGLHSARIVMSSVDFAEIEALQVRGDWARAAEVLSGEARRLEQAGADFLLICTNTMHKVAPEVEAAIGIPMLHIADATGAALKAKGIHRIGLLGTKFTMEQAFYRDRLTERFGIDVLVPGEKERALVHEVIYSELCLGRIRSDSRRAYLEIIEQLRAQGAEGVILGCTEIALLIRPSDTEMALFDTAAIHAERAVAFALESA